MARTGHGGKWVVWNVNVVNTNYAPDSVLHLTVENRQLHQLLRGREPLAGSCWCNGDITPTDFSFRVADHTETSQTPHSRKAFADWEWEVRKAPANRMLVA
jgi:hypothetical protein